MTNDADTAQHLTAEMEVGIVRKEIAALEFAATHLHRRVVCRVERQLEVIDAAKKNANDSVWRENQQCVHKKKDLHAMRLL